MMHKLRLKFIRIAMAALAAAVILVTAAINVMNWLNVRAEIRETVAFLAESDGTVSPERANEWAGRNKHRNNVLTQSVYFIARSEGNGSVQITGQGRNGSVSREEAADLLERAAASGRESGFLDDYCYQRLSSRNGSAWIFLNCESYLTASRNLLLFSAVVCAAGILLSLLTVSLLSALRTSSRSSSGSTSAIGLLTSALTLLSASVSRFFLAASSGG